MSRIHMDRRDVLRTMSASFLLLGTGMASACNNGKSEPEPDTDPGADTDAAKTPTWARPTRVKTPTTAPTPTPPAPTGREGRVRGERTSMIEQVIGDIDWTGVRQPRPRSDPRRRPGHGHRSPADEAH